MEHRTRLSIRLVPCNNNIFALKLRIQMSELYASVASCKLPINDSFLSISLRNKTFNGVPEHVYIGDSERNALSLQYAKAYLRYIKPGTVLGRVVQLQLIA